MDTCLTVILLHDYCTQTYTNQHKLYFLILYCNFICVLSVVIIKTDDDDDDGLKNILLYQTQKVHFDKPNLEQCLEIEAGKTKTEHILVESSSDN